MSLVVNDLFRINLFGPCSYRPGASRTQTENKPATAGSLRASDVSAHTVARQIRNHPGIHSEVNPMRHIARNRGSDNFN